jgi:hypothetical protein
LAFSKGIGGHQAATMRSEEWLTPPDIIKALGSFDLDPCCPENMPWETAIHYMTPSLDGLAQSWFGRVFMNPPYSRKIVAWMEKMADHDHGTALVFARTETDWFERFVWKRASAIFFFYGRLHFHRIDGTVSTDNAGGPSCLVAYGPEDMNRLRKCGLDGKFLEIY